MAGQYTVRQGDHLSKIAKAFGFSDFNIIWNDGNNADLKNLRQDPNILLPGDSLYIPDRQVREESRGTDQKHKFETKKPELKLRVILEDQYEDPVAGAACLLSLGSETRNVTTDGTGQIEEVIQPEMHDAVLVIQDAQTPYQNSPIAIKIGDLDPLKEISGQVGRLNNLGYFAGDAEHPDHLIFESAVEEFQCDNGLKVDGACGPLTQAKLKQIHGS